jgi:hypothetical protein
VLTINIPGEEYFDESLGDNGEFVTPTGMTIELEHSLVSLSKWEAQWEKPFLIDTEKSVDETFSYIHAMVLTPEVTLKDVKTFPQETIAVIDEYINRKMTATWFSNAEPSKKSSETITSELIYYWMIALQVPIECETWHLNRLITLIRVCNQKNSPPKKMSREEVLRRQREQNAARRAASGSAG